MNKAGEFVSEMDTGTVVKCCSCGKEHERSENRNGWHRFSAHQDENSFNGAKYYDVCSIECYLSQVRQSYDELKNTETATIDGMDLKFANKLLFFFGA